jgi:hypothetical protein
LVENLKPALANAIATINKLASGSTKSIDLLQWQWVFAYKTQPIKTEEGLFTQAKLSMDGQKLVLQARKGSQIGLYHINVEAIINKGCFRRIEGLKFRKI